MYLVDIRVFLLSPLLFKGLHKYSQDMFDLFLDVKYKSTFLGNKNSCKTVIRLTQQLQDILINIYITEIDSGFMQYRNLRIRDIVDQTPRHRLRSCCLARFSALPPLGIARRRSNHQCKARCVLQLMRTTNLISDQISIVTSRRDVDVCPPTVPSRNLDIFRSRTSI